MHLGEDEVSCLIGKVRAGEEAEAMLQICEQDQRDFYTKIAIDGRASRDEMIMANMGLVVSVAKRFRATGAQIEDMVQEGVFGVIRALADFDPTRGVGFATYATWWIRAAIEEGLKRERLVRVPEHARRYVRDAQTQGAKLSEREQAVAAACKAPVALELITECGEDGLTYCIEDDVAGQLEAEWMVKMLDCLSAQERYVLDARSGALSGVPLGYDEIGENLGRSHAGVRWIECCGLSKLRHPCQIW